MDVWVYTIDKQEVLCFPGSEQEKILSVAARELFIGGGG